MFALSELYLAISRPKPWNKKTHIKKLELITYYIKKVSLKTKKLLCAIGFLKGEE
jgi:hypothetical protein